MKGLSIEQKAKAYDKALGKAEDALNDGTISNNTIAYLQDIFPELKESEDEKIRKTLIRFHKSTIDVDGIKGEDIIAWLENLNLIKANSPQLGEQKTTDKVESKFHEGDWVILTAGELSTTLQIVSVDINKKLYWFNDSSYLPIVDEECLHHWTIQDAKGGDVLSDGTTIFIFKDLLSDGSVMSYCDYDTDSGESDAFCPLSANLMCSKITPATKEQCDTLFAKMKEAGYEWNAEKKVLKEIEHKPTIKVEPKFKVGDWVIDRQDIVHQIANVIENVTNHTYGYDIVGGGYFNDNVEGVRLWTIQDAKDGDVLASELCYSIILFKGIRKDNNIDFYCDYDFSETDVPGDRFSVNNGQHYGNVEVSEDFHPATKEQRDTLEKAMTNAGWEFDFEKKELKKIEESENIKEISFNSEKASEEYIAWLKSLKQRIGG